MLLIKMRCLACIAVLLVGTGLFANLGQSASLEDADAVRVLYLELEGPVTPAQEELLKDAVDACSERDASLLLLRLDTPGGLVNSMRSMVKSMLNAPVPVAVWVGPSGAHAASAGVFLVAASSVAAMAPSTSIGAASPVDIGGGDVSKTMASKVQNDLMSLLRGVPRAKDRNLEWYQRSVEEAASLTAQEAVMERVVEFVAQDPYDFLDQAGTKGIETASGTLRFTSEQVVLLKHEPGMRYRFLSWLLHPQIAYMLLLGGIAGLFFEVTTPGAVLPGVLGGMSLLLGLYALSILPTNAAGVLLVLFALVLFILELKITSFGLLTLAGIISMFIGSLLLVEPGQGFSALPLTMIIVTVAGVALIVGFCLYLVGRSMRSSPATGAESLVGRFAEVRQWQGGRGVVFVDGALWSARSGSVLELARGDQVRIVQMQGLLLEVEAGEAVNQDNQNASFHGGLPATAAEKGKE